MLALRRFRTRSALPEAEQRHAMRTASTTLRRQRAKKTTVLQRQAMECHRSETIHDEINTHTHTPHTHIHTNTHSHLLSLSHTHTNTHTYIYIYIYIYQNKPTNKCIYMYIAMNKYMYAAYINMIIHDLPWSSRTIHIHPWSFKIVHGAARFQDVSKSLKEDKVVIS